MKKIFAIFLLPVAYSLLPTTAHAVCPVCTVGVVAGLGLSRWLGIDDIVSGIWIGGITISMSLWTINWLVSKKWTFKGMNWLVILAYYLTISLPLYFKEIIGHPFNKFWGIDKLVLGILLGTIFFLLGNISYKIIKSKNNGKAWFPFQKVVMPIFPLIILSIIFYFLTK